MVNLSEEGSIKDAWCRLEVRNESYLAGCIYRPPQSEKALDERVTETLTWTKKCLEKGQYNRLLICGDFNYPGIKWYEGLGGIESNEEDLRFLHCLDDLYLHQNLSCPIFHKVAQGFENLLDLIITSECNRIYELETKPILGNVIQGHSVLEFKFAVKRLETVKSNEDRLSYHTAGQAVYE